MPIIRARDVGQGEYGETGAYRDLRGFDVILIRPEVAMYAAFARLNYKPWYAFAEFVDNSLQSALTNMDALQRAAGGTYRLLVEIDASEEGVDVRDNAAGIHQRDYARAFLPASPPPDTSGLSEFGLGMKAAASWFARRWSVRTSALGEPVERTITFDIPKIVETSCEHLDPVERNVPGNEHYTTLTLRDPPGASSRPHDREDQRSFTKHLPGISSRRCARATAEWRGPRLRASDLPSRSVPRDADRQARDMAQGH